ncbi:hypothetical protein B0T09DRAFT_398765 [Sordaria sp. MPI-SDFR-AT-0083]|nr:hypothetical protein B0T09DRAFT_398765 [Sordaria sp. MPI-SDFR-AT-0083]
MGSTTLDKLSEALLTIDDLGDPSFLQKQDVIRDTGMETSILQVRTIVPNISTEAAAVMGLRKGREDNEDDVSLYSEDIFEIQISGPHFEDSEGKKKRSMIDGIARKHLMNKQTMYVTAYSQLFSYHYPVKSANHDYDHSILAVMSPFSDHAKEDVLQLAKAADPRGERTLCVLTHADVRTSSVQTTFHPFQKDTHGLGCFWVRNRGAGKGELSAGQVRARELALFAESQWANFSGLEAERTIVNALKSALQMPLRDLAKECLDRQRTTVLVRLSSCKNELLALGPAIAWEFDFTMIFREQAAKWALHANYLMESAIITVHRFIYEVMEDRQAWDHKEILVKMELGCRCQTYNPNLEEAIMKIGWEDSRTTLVESYHDQKRQLGSERAFDAAVEAAFGSCAPVDELHDILQAYYKIATDRFPDNICRQAVSYFLLKADESPVKIPTAEFIANLSDSQLERIAGEDAMTRAKRLSLEAELEPLEKALKVLRE